MILTDSLLHKERTVVKLKEKQMKKKEINIELAI